MIDAALHGVPFTVFGDGSITRDFILVHDVASAITLMLDSPAELELPLVLNVGTGRETSVSELMDMIRSGIEVWPKLGFCFGSSDNAVIVVL